MEGKDEVLGRCPGTPDVTFVFNTVEHIFSNAIVVESVNEMTVMHLVERLAKIK